MTDDVLPWIAATYGQVSVGPEFYVSFGSNSDAKQDEINIQDVFDLAKFPAHFDYIRIEGTIGSLSHDALNLLNLLQNDGRIWNSISFRANNEDQPSSPAFLAIVTAAMKKAKCLDIECTLSDTTAYACLATGLLAHDGIQELELYGADNLEVDDAKVLAEAMVCTTRLKSLQLAGENLRDEHVCSILVEGLKRNRSLESLEINVEDFGNDGSSLPELLRTLQNHCNLRALALSGQIVSAQVMEVLREWLGREGCKLQDLQIRNVSPLPTFSGSHKSFKCRTLKRLELINTDLSSNSLEALFLEFPNLSILSLFGNNVCDLTPLESILCREDCTINELDLGWNDISHESIMKFVDKIPLMKSLRRLHLSDNPFLKEEIILLEGTKQQSTSLRPLLKRIKDSKSLEQLTMTCQTSGECNKADKIELCHTMNVNRGGRYGIEVESVNHSISLAMWPKILYRASSIQYFVCLDSTYWEEKEPTDKSPRASVVFSLLRDHAYIFEHCGKVQEKEDER
ncbi:unnamed protein product [Cylindrotheca closterium]|uniref:Uncharacterized protein n=1 Tax=Cylindrotheca closterium TaxID=2856 RepID=A0AAD2CTH7_9STRA|nr:unnamed protein product [Cylindrotheca closterium]